MTSTNNHTTRTEWEWDNPVFRTLEPAHYASPDNTGLGIHRSWADHRDKRDIAGVITYTCHPYTLAGEALDDFETLRAAGWQVRVTGSEYNAGRTVRVDITPPPRLVRDGRIHAADLGCFVASLPFSCPTCRATAGEPCNVRQGGRVVHLARQDKHIRNQVRLNRGREW